MAGYQGSLAYVAKPKQLVSKPTRFLFYNHVTDKRRHAESVAAAYTILVIASGLFGLMAYRLYTIREEAMGALQQPLIQIGVAA